MVCFALLCFCFACFFGNDDDSPSPPFVQTQQHVADGRCIIVRVVSETGSGSVAFFAIGVCVCVCVCVQGWLTGNHPHKWFSIHHRFFSGTGRVLILPTEHGTERNQWKNQAEHRTRLVCCLVVSHLPSYFVPSATTRGSRWSRRRRFRRSRVRRRRFRRRGRASRPTPNRRFRSGYPEGDRRFDNRRAPGRLPLQSATVPTVESTSRDT
jgi:hypothetical protein